MQHYFLVHREIIEPFTCIEGQGVVRVPIQKLFLPDPADDLLISVELEAAIEGLKKHEYSTTQELPVPLEQDSVGSTQRKI